MMVFNIDFPFFKNLKFKKHGDFNPEWFEDVGTTILTIHLFNSLYPILETSYRLLDRCRIKLLDRGISLICWKRN